MMRNPQFAMNSVHIPAYVSKEMHRDLCTPISRWQQQKLHIQLQLELKHISWHSTL